jgi:8-hydroxy-5-deazaflavin:NADPH oxidoreductase
VELQMSDQHGRAITPAHVGILGGTGKLGRGLARRWRRAGVSVTLGSRDGDRAARTAADLVAEFPTSGATLTGASNAVAAAAPLVVAAIPFAHARDTVADVAEPLAGRVLLSAVSPLAFDDAGPHPTAVEGASSAAALLAGAAPDARVVAGLHTVSSASLSATDRELDDHVLMCGDDDDALAEAAAAVAALGVRPVVAGPLRLAATLEAMTAVLIGVNQRHRVHAGIRLTGLAD